MNRFIVPVAVSALVVSAVADELALQGNGIRLAFDTAEGCGGLTPLVEFEWWS